MTTIELKSIAYKIVRNSAIKTLINGEVYNTTRKLNSTANDVVIGALELSGGTVGYCTLIINIYARDIKQADGTFAPDLKTLKDASALIKSLFDDVYIADKKVNIDFERERDYKSEKTDEHIVALRFQTRNINK